MLFAIARIRAGQSDPEAPPKTREDLARDNIADACDRIVHH